MPNAEIKYDVVVLGAGIYGIQAARTYLEIHPEAKVAIVERDSCVGGVWSLVHDADRSYDEFWTQTPIGMAEFSDQKMHHIPRDDQYYGFFKAVHVSNYLESYVKNRVYNGSSLSTRIWHNTAVLKLAREGGLWAITVSTHYLPIMAINIIDATGLTSYPSMPDIVSSNGYEPFVIHHKDFGSKRDSIFKDADVKRVTVIGGAKSAADMAYAAAKSRKSVAWVIRRSGRGPSLFVPAKSSGPYKNSNDFFYTRMTSLFLASLWTVIPVWLTWLYQTGLGKKLFSKVWAKNHNNVVSTADYDRADGQGNGFYNLKPDTELFWQNDSTSINQRPDFFDVIAKTVTVYRQDIKEFRGRDVILEDSTKLSTDVVLLGTGWRVSHPHIESLMAKDLGLPVETRLLQPSNHRDDWKREVRDSDREVLANFPILGECPECFRRDTIKPPLLSPFKLYKSMLTIRKQFSPFYTVEGTPNIVFVGKVMLGNHFRAAEVQALFAVAALDGNIPALKDYDAEKQQRLMERDVAKAYAWCRRRYPGSVSEIGNFYYFDMLAYTDHLLQLLNLKSHRNSSWWKDLLKPCRASDLRGCIQEYKDRYKL